MFLIASVMSGPQDVVKSVPDIIREASKSTEGLFALMILILGGLAYYFFRSAGEKAKIGIFVLLFCGVGLYGYALLSAAGSRGTGAGVPSSAVEMDSPMTRSLVIGGTVIDSNNNGSVGQALVSVTETNDNSLTDNNGVFKLMLSNTNLRPGAVIHLRITKNGYKALTWQVTAPNDSLTVPLDSAAR